MGYSSVTPQHPSTTMYGGHTGKAQGCAPGSVEMMDHHSQGNMESPGSIGSASSVDMHHAHGPGSVDNSLYHHGHHRHQQNVYDGAPNGNGKYAMAPQSPMVMCNPPTPQSQQSMHLSQPPTPQLSKSFMANSREICGV